MKENKMRERDKDVDKKTTIKDQKKVKKVKNSQLVKEENTEDAKVDDRAKVEEMFEQAEMEHHDLNCLQMIYLINQKMKIKIKWCFFALFHKNILRSDFNWF